MSYPSDQEFLDALRAAVLRYLASVDAWEAAYQRYYRMPGFSAKVSSDLEPEQREFEAARRALEDLLPRARSLCQKHEMRDPFAGLLRIDLGRHAPQHRVETAIGRNERNAVTDCLVQLSDACRVWDLPSAVPAPPPPDKNSLIKRLVSYFY